MNATETSSARDVGLIQLDLRVPMAKVPPIHPGGLQAIGSGLKCRELLNVTSSHFGGLLVGYRDRVAYGMRNFAPSSGWGLDVQEAGQSGFGEYNYSNNWWIGGSIPQPEGGDSGGALLSQLADGIPFLCGVISRYYPTFHPFPGIGADTAGIDSDGNLAFLTAHVIDAMGNFKGECNQGGSSLDPLRDVDTDGI